MEQLDLIIIGSGPAGYSAAIYAGRAQLKVVLFAGEQAGGQLMNTTLVENYAGFKEGKMGPDLMIEMQQQAERFGTQIEYRTVSRVDFSEPDLKKVYVQVKGEEVEYSARSVIVSTGAQSIMPGILGEKELLGKGVATCAVCDAAFYKEKEVFVVGGGDSAMEDALALTKFAKSVTIVHRRDTFKASKIMQERVLKHPKVKVLWNSEVKEARGEGKLSRLLLLENGVEHEVPADGLFFAIGHRPMTDIFINQLQLDDHGYIVTRQSPTKAGVEMAQQEISPEGLVRFPTMTSVPGVFAAGDVVDIRYKQAITSAGQGAAAAIDAERWLEGR